MIVKSVIQLECCLTNQTEFPSESGVLCVELELDFQVDFNCF